MQNSSVNIVGLYRQPIRLKCRFRRPSYNKFEGSQDRQSSGISLSLSFSWAYLKCEFSGLSVSWDDPNVCMMKNTSDVISLTRPTCLFECVGLKSKPSFAIRWWMGIFLPRMQCCKYSLSNLMINVDTALRLTVGLSYYQMEVWSCIWSHLSKSGSNEIMK